MRTGGSGKEKGAGGVGRTPTGGSFVFLLQTQKRVLSIAIPLVDLG